ncbi:hypothetical protein ABZP36_020781 [Zizania latifolia]
MVAVCPRDRSLVPTTTARREGAMEESSLSHTPTWVVAAVCFGIVSVSLAAERFLHYLGKARPSSLHLPSLRFALAPRSSRSSSGLGAKTRRVETREGGGTVERGEGTRAAAVLLSPVTRRQIPCKRRLSHMAVAPGLMVDFHAEGGMRHMHDEGAAADSTPMATLGATMAMGSLKHDQKTLYSALERLKEELMLLGFISFVLSLSQNFIAGICIPENATHLMLPCKKENRHAEGVKLCKKKDEVPLLSVEALHQLHIFIFVLGLVHVLFCATTILLGVAKIRKWKHWETGILQEMREKQEESPQTETTPSHTVLQRNHQRNFVRERTKGSWMKLAVVSWIIAFLKQFHHSVSKSDYKALRSAFVLIHYPSHPLFDFHKYLVRALEHDFKRVVSISWYLWLFVILFLLLNINGWHAYFWLAFLPLFLLLVVGAKLQHIITRLAQEAKVSLPPSEGGQGTGGVIKPSKEYFWFYRPEIILHLIHFIIFQNSFEIGFFFWVLVTYGFDSCIMEKKVYVISRLVIGVLIEVICSYITLPIYAIVTHMSGDIKLRGIVSDLHEPITEWAAGAKGVKGRSSIRLNNAPTLKNAGGDPMAGTCASVTKVEVTQPRNHERSGSSPAPEPDPDVIVSVADDADDVIVSVADDGGGGHNRR